MPIFDIKVSAQRKNIYSKVQQNELALELYQNGCFNPDLADQAMLLLETMDFEEKETEKKDEDTADTLLGDILGGFDFGNASGEDEIEEDEFVSFDDVEEPDILDTDDVVSLENFDDVDIDNIDSSIDDADLFGEN